MQSLHYDDKPLQPVRLETDPNIVEKKVKQMMMINVIGWNINKDNNKGLSISVRSRVRY